MRPKREPNEYGELHCKPGDHWVPIDNFYVVNPDVTHYIITRIEDGEEVTYHYGKLHAYCKDCQRTYNANRARTQRQQRAGQDVYSGVIETRALRRPTSTEEDAAKKAARTEAFRQWLEETGGTVEL